MNIVNTLRNVGFAAALVVGAATGAQAGVVITDLGATAGTGSADLNVDAIFPSSATFGGSKATVGSFTDYFDFSIDLDSFISSQVEANFTLKGARDVTITSVFLDSEAFSLVSGDWVLANYVIGASPITHRLTVNYDVGAGTGTSPKSYSGSFDVAAVPEPATWGMLVVGFGLVGAGLRSRKRQVVLA